MSYIPRGGIAWTCLTLCQLLHCVPTCRAFYSPTGSGGSNYSTYCNFYYWLLTFMGSPSGQLQRNVVTLRKLESFQASPPHCWMTLKESGWLKINKVLILLEFFLFCTSLNNGSASFIHPTFHIQQSLPTLTPLCPGVGQKGNKKK